MAPDDGVEHLADVLAGLERAEHGVDGVRADLMTAFDQLHELVDHRARVGNLLLVALEGEPVAAQAHGAVEALLERVEDAVRDPGQLGRDGVRDVERLLHRASV